MNVWVSYSLLNYILFPALGNLLWEISNHISQWSKEYVLLFVSNSSLRNEFSLKVLHLQDWNFSKHIYTKLVILPEKIRFASLYGDTNNSIFANFKYFFQQYSKFVNVCWVLRVLLTLEWLLFLTNLSHMYGTFFPVFWSKKINNI